MEFDMVCHPIKEISEEESRAIIAKYVRKWTEIGRQSGQTDTGIERRVTERIRGQISRRIFVALLPLMTRSKNSPLVDEIFSHDSSKFPGSFNVGNLAEYDSFQEVLTKQTLDKGFHQASQVAHQVPFVWTFENIALAFMRPLWVDVDNQGRLHSWRNRAAIQFPDDFSLFAWHGTPIPAELITNPFAITIPTIEEEPNAEIKRVMLEIYGWGRYLKESGAELIDETRDQLNNPLLLWRKQIGINANSIEFVDQS